MALAFEDFARVKIVSKNYIRNVVRLAKTRLTQGDHNVNKKLYNSLEGDYLIDDKNIEVYFSYEDYGDYQDQGIKGYESSLKAPKSPFKYKKKMANLTAIKSWVKARKFQFRNKDSGRFMSYDTTAFLIARSIARDGIKPTRWFSEPQEKYFDKFAEEIINKYPLDLEDYGYNSDI